MYDLRCLGEATLRNPTGELVHFRSRKHLALLIYMALNADRAHRRERLAAMLWSDSEESKARHSLSQALYAVRRLLDGAVRIEGDDLELETGDLRVDAVELEHLFDAGHSGAAADIYKGDFLEGFWVRSAHGYEEWILHERARFSALARDALRKAIKSGRNRADWSEVRTRAERLVRLDPFDEAAYIELMRALWMQGDRAAALERYDDLKSVLASELDTAPSKETKALVERIRERPVRGGWNSVSLLQEPEPSIFVEPPFVGRKKELAELSEEWEIVSTGESRTVALVGDAGIGKTRLATEFMKTLELDDVTVLRGRCYEAEQSLPYGPIAEALKNGLEELDLEDVKPLWLAELARIVPEAHGKYGDLPEPAHLDAEGGRRRLYEGIAQIFRGACEVRPIMLVVDDLHWADESSVALLHYIRRRVRSGLFLITTYRGEEAAIDAHSGVFGPGSIEGKENTSIVLEALSDAEEADLLESLIHTPMTRGLMSALQQMTGGNPFFAIELARTIADSDTGLATTTSRVPRGIRALLDRRFEKLSVHAAALAQQAAFLGTHLSYEVLSAAAGLPALELDGLFLELQRAGIMSNAGELVCFRHDLIRKIAQAQAPRALRKTLHMRAAQALIEAAAGPAEIARHFSEAGEYQSACKWALVGADKAEAVFAFRSAAELLELALRHSSDPAECQELTGRIGRLYQRICDYANAEPFLQKRLQLTVQSSRPLKEVFEARSSLLFLEIYSGAMSMSDSGNALNAFFLELQDSGIDAPILESQILCTLFWTAARCFETALAEEAITRIKDLHERSTIPEVSYRTARSLGIYEQYRGRLERSKELLLQAVETAKHLEDETLVADAYLGLSTLPSRSLSRALSADTLAMAKRIAENNADPRRAAGILANCAVFHNHLGEFDRAEELLNSAVRVLDLADDTSDLATSIAYNLGYIAEARGDYEAAKQHWKVALNLSTEGEVLPVALEAEAGLGRLEVRNSNIHEARSHAARALRLARKGRYFVDERFGLVQLLAELRYASGREEKALQGLAVAALGAIGTDVPLYLASQSKRIELLLRAGRIAEADNIASQLRAVGDQYRAPWWALRLETLTKRRDNR